MSPPDDTRYLNMKTFNIGQEDGGGEIVRTNENVTPDRVKLITEQKRLHEGKEDGQGQFR